VTRAIPTRMQVGPDPATGWPRIDVVLDDGQVIAVVLDPAHAMAFARRVDAITSGMIATLPPSRRVLEIELGSVEALADTERPMAIGGSRR
jgi:hypothetical protein